MPPATIARVPCATDTTAAAARGGHGATPRDQGPSGDGAVEKSLREATTSSFARSSRQRLPASKSVEKRQPPLLPAEVPPSHTLRPSAFSNGTRDELELAAAMSARPLP
jgi:hypothetical protein